jgi:hypothetical protein
VVVSKADLLAEEDRARMTSYVAEELGRATGGDIQVSLVSTEGADAPLAISWFDRHVAPIGARAREEHQSSLRRKFANLQEIVVATLRARLRSRSGRAGASRRGDLQAVSRSTEDALREARLAAEHLGSPDPALAEACLKQVVANLTAVADRPNEVRVAEQTRLALAGATDEIRTTGRQILVHARDALEGALAPLRGPEPIEVVRNEAASGLLALGALPTEIQLDAGEFARAVLRPPFRGTIVWRLLVTQALRDHREPVAEGLRRFALRASTLCTATIERMAKAVDTLLEPERALRSDTPPGVEQDPSSLLDDLRLLGAAPGEEASGIVAS